MFFRTRWPWTENIAGGKRVAILHAERIRARRRLRIDCETPLRISYSIKPVVKRRDVTRSDRLIFHETMSRNSFLRRGYAYVLSYNVMERSNLCASETFGKEKSTTPDVNNKTNDIEYVLRLCVSYSHSVVQRALFGSKQTLIKKYYIQIMVATFRIPVFFSWYPPKGFQERAMLRIVRH